MSKKAKDNRNAVISSSEEYEEALKRLKYYIDEYKWIVGTEDQKTKIKEVNDEAAKIRPMINSERNKEQLYYRKYYNTLIRKKNLIESGEYQAYLRRNMISLFASIMQYKIDSQDYTVLSIARGLIKKDKSLIDDMKMDRMLSHIRMWDGVPKEEDLALQSPEEILAYIDKHCNLVGIRIPKQIEDASLLPTMSNGYLSKEQKQLIEMLDRLIDDKDMNLSDFSTSIESSKENDIEKESDFEIRSIEGKDKMDREVKNTIPIKEGLKHVSRQHEQVKGKEEGEISE